MRKYLLPESGKFYKANLHSHSTLSDGSFTVAELKEEYKKRGYSILAASDHDALHSNYSLSEPDFLILTAYEISVRSDDTLTPHSLRKIVDLNLFAKTPDNLIQCGYHPDTVEWLVERGKLSREEVGSIKYAGELRDLHYYPANINKIIRTANENGFLVSINHPEWDNINYSDYGMFEGAFAVEVYNHGSYVFDGLHDSEAVFEDILKSGKRIFALATDDNHNTGRRFTDSFGGFTMIKAPELSYPAVIGALERGEFYASTGPLIEELYYEDGYVHIKTSEAVDICMNTIGRRGGRAASDDGSPITGAAFKVDLDYGYMRFRVRDMKGNRAWTNAYYTDEFYPGAKRIRAIL